MNREVKPLAIVGMACRFPKGLEDLQSLWNALKERFSAIDRVPGDRWSVERYFSSNPIAKGKSYIRRGGFLTHDITKFDASFFGISPRDAENMDPQQRLLLEVVWEAFENSGMILPDYSGRSVGVYVGGFMLDHMITQMSAANRSAINQNTAAGMMMTMLSNRISHTFDFRGPSLSIDTACSSSLVAFHYACQDLWSSRTEMAVVGGSNVMLRPEYPMGMCKGHFLSRDGECKSFDERGDGYGRGEGAGIVLVKPLESALRDGDQVLATVIATGSNQDGRTPGISMPSGEAQQALIESICREYAIDPSSINYVECHGTGTAIGDPTEVKAIGATYGAARKSANRTPVIVGSIKSNIGHLEAAAGVAGVIKATLTLLHRQTTPIANLQKLNPAIPLDELNVRVSDELIDLEKDVPVRVAVNSFGYGGSNAHVILESVPASCDPHAGMAVENTDSASAARSLPYVLPISGRSDKAIEAAAKKYAELLATDVAVLDVIYSAAHHRAHLSQRAVVMGNSRSDLIAALNALGEGVEHPGVVRGSEPFTGKRQPVFVFTGMGPQWWAMGQALYRENAVYRAAAEEADAVFQEVAGFSILAEMLKSEEDSQITKTEFAQPANLIIQLGLTAVLRSAGITPGAVVGHSVGELSSAHVGGVLSLRDAMTVAFHRSRLQATCKGTGGMLAVGQSRDRIENRIAKYAGAVSIAAVNGPGNITIAGDRDALAELAVQWTEENVFNKMLDVEVPYHSPMMDPIMDDLRSALKDVRANLPTLPLYSTVTGKQVNEVAYDADYWPQNVRQPVEFESAIRALIEDGFNNFIEVGPHPVLATSIRDCIKQAGRDCRQTLTLRRNTPEIETLHRGMMSVYTNGCEIDWSVHTRGGRFIHLPNYCWQREFFWNENDRAKQDRIANVEYPMLGIQEAPGAPVYRNDFDHEPMLYLRDHVVSGVPILPAAGYVESLFELASIQFEFAKGFAIREAKILAPMIINAERGLDCVTAYDPTTRHATIRGLENGKLGTGQVHLTASLAGLNKFQSCRRNISELIARLPITEDLSVFYKGLSQIGLAYGPAFQSVKELRSNATGDHVLARVEMMPELMGNLDQYCLHPTLLDACFQSLMVMLKGSDTTYLPTGFGELCLYQRQSPEALWCYSECVQRNARNIECNMTLMDNDGRVIATLRSMRLTAASRRERVDQWGDPVKRQILAYDWKFCEALNEPKRLGHWLVVGSNERIAADLMEQMQSFGATVVAQAQFGNQFEHNEGVYTLRTASVEDATQMFDAVGELDGVVFLNGLASKMDSDDPTAERAVAQIFTLTQALIANKAERKPRVYAVTQGAFAIKDFDRTVHAGQSAINGFARVAFNELDALRSAPLTWQIA